MRDNIYNLREFCYYCKRVGIFEDQVCQFCATEVANYTPDFELNDLAYQMAFGITSDVIEYATEQSSILLTIGNTWFRDIHVRVSMESEAVFRDVALRRSIESTDSVLP